MPLITFESGTLTATMKAELVQQLTAVAANITGIPAGAFFVAIRELPDDNIAIGGKTVRELMAGGGTLCPLVGDNVQTKPGNTVGPSIQGLNTRFGEYGGGLSSSSYPPDLITNYSQVSGQGALSLDGSGTIVYGKSNGKGGGTESVSADANGKIGRAHV